MEKTVKSYLQLLLKLFNSIAGLAGIAMIMYGLWLIRLWQSDTKGSSSDTQTPFPWFVHAFIGLGISFCAITCLGHFAAHTAYSHLLTCYISVMSLLLFIETPMMAHIFPSFEWEKDLPEDPTGRFDDFKDYVESELSMCKWLAVLVVLAQGVSIMLATVMKTLRTDLEMFYIFDLPSESMASESSPTPVASSASNSALKWDVFLSYRGPETGPTFTGHLFAALDRHAIKAYKDDYKLRMGDVVSDALKEAIKESKIYIVVFSKDYASSPWCLDELVDIVNFNKKEKRLIIPVFHNIDPSIVRHVIGGYKKAIKVHEKGFYADQKKKVDNWRTALKVAANVSGEHICGKNREEADVIYKIVADILPRINPKGFDQETVGLELRVGSIVAMLSSENSVGVTKIGIYGMGGVGKTTLAKAAFTKKYLDFDGSCFLANVTADSGIEEDGMKSLQQQLLNDILLENEKDVKNVANGKNLIKARLKNKRILVVIDDLNHSFQHKSLEVGSFAQGSVVIVTTRHKDILEDFEVKPENRYMVNELGPAESLILFKRHAFRFGSKPDNALMKLSDNILSLAGGLPLALEVFGSSLRTKYTVEEWRDFIEKLEKTPNKKIQDRLVISFNAIDDDPQVKKMFLDVACFFVGKQKGRVFKLLETYYTNVNVKINNLKGRCLLTINDRNVLHMHDLLREMGREVARNNSPGEPEKHSRLWLPEDIQSVLVEENEESKAIEGIYYKENEVTSWQVPLTMETFKKMKKLRFVRLVGFENPTGSFLQTFKDLRWLCWKSCPLQHLPPDFKPLNLGILELRHSNMRTLEPSMVFQKLKILDMGYSSYLARTPDFNMLPSLEGLVFESCESLKEVHISIGMLTGLVSLKLGGCVKLASLPKTIGNLKALKHLDVCNCKSLVELPEELGYIKSLEKLEIGGLDVESVPRSFNLLNNLIELDASVNKRLITLPEELGNITSLKMLHVMTTSVSDLPVSIGNLSNLVNLTLSHNQKLKTLPDTICNLRSLKFLTVENCKKLEELPSQMWKITSLRELSLSGTKMLKVASSDIPLSVKRLDLSCKVFTALPRGISQLSNLVYLNVKYCSRLLSIEELPPNLKELNAPHCRSMKTFRATLKHLEILNLENCRDLEEIQGLDQLASLKELNINMCINLLTIGELRPSLRRITAEGCASMKSLPDLSHLKHLWKLDLTGCSALIEIQGLEELSSIEELYFGDCSLSLLQQILTKRFFQTYSGFEKVIQICLGAEMNLPNWMGQLCDSESRRRVSLDLTPNMSHNFLGTIVCFKEATSVHSEEDTYSIKNITSGFIWSGSIEENQSGVYIIVVPGSIFSVRNDDHIIEFTAAKREFLAIHLLYND